MSTIKAFIRTVSDKPKQPISVQWQHRGMKLVIATGFSIEAANWKNQKASGKDALDVNTAINTIKGDLQSAEDLISGRGDSLTKEAMKEAYQSLTTARKASANTNTFQVAEVAVVSKSEVIRTNEEQLCTPDSESLLHLLEQYMALKKRSYSRGGYSVYVALQTILNDYGRLSIYKVDEHEMYKLQDFMVARGLTNESIIMYLKKVRSVLHHYAEDMNLSPSYKKFRCILPQKEDNVLYLEANELKELMEFEFDKPRYDKMRDILLLMCNTGLRYSDVFFDPRACVSGNEITITTKKTRQRLSIPLTPVAKSVLERGLVKRVEFSYFIKMLRETLSQLPSLQYTETIIRYNGHNRIEITKPKWALLGSHTGRRTFINLCIENGVPTSKISAITGHKRLETFNVYTDKRRNLSQELAKVTIFG